MGRASTTLISSIEIKRIVMLTWRARPDCCHEATDAADVSGPVARIRLVTEMSQLRIWLIVMVLALLIPRLAHRLNRHRLKPDSAIRLRPRLPCLSRLLFA